jgi:hypothetical protein
MALNMDAIGKPIGPMKRDYTWKDAVLYALGVGAGFSELDYCYEQPLLYRLSGDIFSLHVSPEFAKMAGFEKPSCTGCAPTASPAGPWSKA